MGTSGGNFDGALSRDECRSVVQEHKNKRPRNIASARALNMVLIYIIIFRDSLRRLLRLIIQIRPQPALDFRHGHVFTNVVVVDLVAVEFAYGEIF